MWQLQSRCGLLLCGMGSDQPSPAAQLSYQLNRSRTVGTPWDRGHVQHSYCSTHGLVYCCCAIYRKAAELSKVRGKLSCLVINDLDAGVGRFGNTQVGASGGGGVARPPGEGCVGF